jgi:hypothetical protein
LALANVGSGEFQRAPQGIEKALPV